MQLQLVVLGSGQDGGTPQVGSAAPTTSRTASSIAVLADDVRLLFDASPDLRSQFQLLPTVDRSGLLVDAVFITHCHMGHYTGLAQFGREAANTNQIPLYGSPSVIEVLETNEPWASLFRRGNLRAHPMDDVVHLGRLSIRRIPVPHRAELSDASAFSIAVDERPWLLYLPDIDAWDDWPEAERVLSSHELCLLDATFGSPDELPGRDMSSIPHPFVEETIARFGHLTGRTMMLLGHINHSNPLNDRSSRLFRKAVAAGFVVAEDGMTISRQA